MFFDPGRLTVMHEMIFAETPSSDRADRAGADSCRCNARISSQLFRIMEGQPVCIRLLRPAAARVPAHLPLGPCCELAEALDIPLSAT